MHPSNFAEGASILHTWRPIYHPAIGFEKVTWHLVRVERSLTELACILGKASDVRGVA